MAELKVGMLGYKPSHADVLYLGAHPNVSVCWTVMPGDVTFGRTMMKDETPHAAFINPDLPEGSFQEVLEGYHSVRVVRDHNLVDVLAALLEAATA